MNIIKICAVAVVIVFAVSFTKQVKPEFGVVITIAGTIVMLVYILGFFNNIVTFYNQITIKTGIDQKYFTILLKSIGIGYLVEFASNICRDTGNTAIADKVILAGKISILILAVPILQSIFNIISELI